MNQNNYGQYKQQQQQSLNLSSMLAVIGISREQFQALPNHEKQSLGQKYMQMMSMQQQQQQQQQQTMMPPTPNRPSTAQGMMASQISRPGTSLSHRSPTIPGPSLSDGMANGFKQGLFNGPSTPNNAAQFSQGINMMPNMNSMNSMMPGSPRIGQGQLSGAMGPPGLPRSISGDGMSMPNMNMNMNMGMGMNGATPRPQSSMGMNPMGNSMPMGMGQRPQQQPQTPMRQGSIPPQTQTPQQQHNLVAAMGMHGGSPMTNNQIQAQQAAQLRQGSLPPSNQQPGMPRRPSVPPSGMGMGMGGMPSGGVVAPSSPLPGGLGQMSATAAGAGVTPSGSISAPVLPTAPTSTTNPSQPALPPLPANVSLNPLTTNVTPIPILQSSTLIPPLSAEDIAAVSSYQSTDKAYESNLRAQKMRALEEMRSAFLTHGVGAPAWWEERSSWGTGNGLAPYYNRTRARSRGRAKPRREGLKLPKKISEEDANKPELLVPIRIEFDVDHHKMRDTIIWNIHDPIVTPEIFAQSLVEDYGLASSYHTSIVKTIQDQLADFQAHSFSAADDPHHAEGENLVIRGTIDEKDENWWAAWRKKVKKDAKRAVDEASWVKSKKGGKRANGRQTGGLRKKRKLAGSIKKEKEDADGDVDEEAEEDVDMMADNEMDDGDDEDDDDEDDGWPEKEEEEEEGLKSVSVDEILVDERGMHEDMRILIKLDIIVASMKLDDHFEWDLDNPMASPEGFAEVYAQELGLSGEFKTAIAHSIREQVQTYQKSLFLVGHPSDGSAVQDEELKQSFLPSLTSGARPVSDVSMFTPILNYLSDGELERTEKEKDKDLNKRRKRNTRGRRGVALPDREPIRTYRTPAIGFPELDAATLALQAAANAPMSRRAAAAAASLTIANMVANENIEDGNFTAQPIPAVQPRSVAQQAPMQLQQQKKKEKAKGLFKAPTFPPSVLRARAHVHAPTPSTAADTSHLPPGSLLDKDGQDPSSSSGSMHLSMSLSAQDAKASRVLNAKRAKELEREAKEKEFMDGQHPNYIDGVWHCSNCGCPESIAVGRRKGPLGDKSQCGTCGKFWHRHRRPRPVEYNPDPGFHSGAKQKESDALKTPGNRKKGAAAALRAQNAATPSSAPHDGASTPHTPHKSNGDDAGPSRNHHSKSSPSPATTMMTMKDEDDDRGMSPVSTASSASEAPLAQKVKLNGHASKASASVTPAPTMATPVKAEKPTPVPEPAGASASTSASGSAPTAVTQKAIPPTWISTQMQLMRVKYPDDRFEVILRKVNASNTPEWRIKCLDCPGKLYTPGPQETLSNYEVHLKNRQHRQRVNERLTGNGGSNP